MDTTFPTGGGEAAFSFIGFLIGIIIWLVISGVIGAIISLVLQTAYDKVPQEHRAMPKDKLWFLAIPLYNLYWNFVAVRSVSESFKSYFDSAGDNTVGDCGAQMGQYYAIAFAVGTVSGFIPLVACISPLVGLAALILFIIYVVKLFELGKKITGGGPTGGSGGQPAPDQGSSPSPSTGPSPAPGTGTGAGPSGGSGTTDDGGPPKPTVS